jgi:hypothetical protein
MFLFEEFELPGISKKPGRWLDSQAAKEQVQEDGTSKKVLGTEAKDLLSKLRKRDKDALSRVKQKRKSG